MPFALLFISLTQNGPYMAIFAMEENTRVIKSKIHTGLRLGIWVTYSLCNNSKALPAPSICFFGCEMCDEFFFRFYFRFSEHAVRCDTAARRGVGYVPISIGTAVGC